MKIIKAHKIKLNPSTEQTAQFMRAAGVARFAWNWALDEYKRLKNAGLKVDWNQIKKDFRAKIDTEFPFVREVTKCAPEEAINDLRRTVNIYYQTKKQNNNSTVRFPGHRRRSRKIGGFGLANDKFSVNGHTAKLPKIGSVNMTEVLRFSGKILSGRITEKAGHWYLTITVEMELLEIKSAIGSVGIDFGLKQFATLSTGKIVETQGYFRKSAKRLKGLQRGLVRKKKDSRNRIKWKRRVARLHARIANQRQNFLHKFTTDVCRHHAIICIEDLNLPGLQQTRLAKSFTDAGIGEGIRQLEYKSHWHGGIVQKVGRFFPSSKRCHVCGERNEKLNLAEREWDCIACGTHHDRDLNAALNIELEGLRLLAGCVATSASTPVDVKALIYASVRWLR